MRMQRDWMRAGLATIAAFSLTAGTYWLLGATPKDAQPPTVVINEPTLVVNGCQIKIHLAPNALADQKIGGTSPHMIMQAGPLPQFAVLATNPGSTPVTIHFTTNLQMARVDDYDGRSAPSPPAPVWRKDFALTLPPGQTQTLPIATGAKFNSMELAMLSLENGPQNVTAFTFSAILPRSMQNIAFADTHVEFTTNPYAGQSGDNIWTTNSGTTQPAPSPAASVQPAAKQVAAKTGR